DERRIQQFYRLLYGRSATPEEVQLGDRFLKASVAGEPQAAAPEPPVWQYGYGAYDAASHRVTGFQPLPFWSGYFWQGGKEYPDLKLAYLRLTATGGHPGKDAQHAAIRRWVAPHDGTVNLLGKLE